MTAAFKLLNVVLIKEVILQDRADIVLYGAATILSFADDCLIGRFVNLDADRKLSVLVGLLSQSVCPWHV